MAVCTYRGYTRLLNVSFFFYDFQTKQIAFLAVQLRDQPQREELKPWASKLTHEKIKVHSSRLS